MRTSISAFKKYNENKWNRLDITDSFPNLSFEYRFSSVKLTNNQIQVGVTIRNLNIEKGYYMTKTPSGGTKPSRSYINLINQRNRRYFRSSAYHMIGMFSLWKELASLIKISNYFYHIKITTIKYV